MKRSRCYTVVATSAVGRGAPVLRKAPTLSLAPYYVNIWRRLPVVASAIIGAVPSLSLIILAFAPPSWPAVRTVIAGDMEEELAAILIMRE